jgi:alkyl sulfatase BDS1-like metallo-beta-lactamase superfamily hydrolase
LHNLVFAQPDNQDAKELQADTYEQMGYQTEAPQWRGIHLTAARELREGILKATFTTASPDTIAAMPLDVLFDFAGVHLIGDKAVDTDVRIDFAFTDLDQTWTVWVKRGVLNARVGASPDTQLTVTGPKVAVAGIVLNPASAPQIAQSGEIELNGDASALQRYADVMDQFDPNFNIVTP